MTTTTDSHAQSTQQAQQQAGPEDDNKPSMLYPHVTDWSCKDTAVYLGPRAMGTATTAMQGIRTILGILMQRGVDSDCDGSGRMVLDAITVEGLLCAADACATSIGGALNGEHYEAHRFFHGSPEEEYMSRHARDIASGRKVVVTGDGGKAGAEA